MGSGASKYEKWVFYEGGRFATQFEERHPYYIY